MTSLLEDVQAAAQRAVAYAERRDEGVLDYALESFQLVEAMLAESVDWLPSICADELDNIVTALGCYLLESCRRAFGGEYRWIPDPGQPVLIVGEPVFHVALTTWEKVRGRLKGDPADNIPFHMQGFIARVRQGRPGDRALFI